MGRCGLEKHIPLCSLLLPFGYRAQIARSPSTNSVEKLSGAPAGSAALYAVVFGTALARLDQLSGEAAVDRGTPPEMVTASPGNALQVTGAAALAPLSSAVRVSVRVR